jgi:hypothetical protein
MSKSDAGAQIGPVEIIAEWEGPAIPAPGVLFDEQHAEHLYETGDVAELVAWIAVAAFSAVNVSSAHQAAKAKVLGVLSAWRRRFGQAKIDEVRQQLFEQMQTYRNNRKITDEELRERIQLLFDEIQV